MVNMSKTKRRIGSRRNENRVLKGVIYVQASFNNTIVTVTDVRGQVLCWSSAGACGFKCTRRGTPFSAQTVAENVIRTLMDRVME
jgi:ribosomal protein S11